MFWELMSCFDWTESGILILSFSPRHTYSAKNKQFGSYLYVLITKNSTWRTNMVVYFFVIVYSKGEETAREGKCFMY